MPRTEMFQGPPEGYLLGKVVTGGAIEVRRSRVRRLEVADASGSNWELDTVEPGQPIGLSKEILDTVVEEARTNITLAA